MAKAVSDELPLVTVKAPNFGPHGKFGPFLQVPWLLWMTLARNMNRNKIVELMFFYDFYSLHFSVGCVSMIADSSEKEVQSFHEVQS
jgi:hypothetical protein